MARTYTLTLEDRVVEVEVSEERELLFVKIGERVHAVSLGAIDDGGRLFSLLVDGQSYAIYAHGGRGMYELLVDNESFSVQVERGHGRRREALARTSDGPRLIRSPMAGIVSRVVVAAGQVVERGAVLLILESMKMNNELRAETPGVVDGIRVSAGQRVERGDLLLQLLPG